MQNFKSVDWRGRVDTFRWTDGGDCTTFIAITWTVINSSFGPNQLQQLSQVDAGGSLSLTDLCLCTFCISNFGRLHLPNVTVRLPVSTRNKRLKNFDKRPNRRQKNFVPESRSWQSSLQWVECRQSWMSTGGDFVRKAGRLRHVISPNRPRIFGLIKRETAKNADDEHKTQVYAIVQYTDSCLSWVHTQLSQNALLKVVVDATSSEGSAVFCKIYIQLVGTRLSQTRPVITTVAAQHLQTLHTHWSKGIAAIVPFADNSTNNLMLILRKKTC